MKKDLTRKYIKSLGLLIYFVVLGVERILAVVYGFINHDFSIGGFTSYVHVLTLISVVLAFVIINKQFIYMIKSFFTFKENDLNKLDYKKLAIGAGVILLGGMVHTTYTQLFVQFGAYAGMLVSMLIVVIENYNKDNNKLKLINNYIYIVSFAMAVPVCYKIVQSYIVFLEVYQCIASFVLVSVYTYFMYTFYNNRGEVKFIYISFILLLGFDLPIFILRFNEAMNLFLVIFPGVCLIDVIIDLINYIKQKNCIKINNK